MTAPADRPVAVVTGASSGIGAATARALARAGFHVVLGARRTDRCAEIAAEIDGTAVRLDVTDADSVAAFAAAVPDCRLLVNNAGGAKGLEPVAQADEEDWRWMFETNVIGTLRVTKALLPALLASGDGHIVTVTSIAALETYDNGAGYTGAKHAQAMRGLPSQVAAFVKGMRTKHATTVPPTQKSERNRSDSIASTSPV